MERGVFVLLKHYFGEQATIYYEAVTKAQRVRTLGKKMSLYLIKKNNSKQNRFKIVPKVSFFGQCSKMQLIPFKNFNIKTCFIQFLWFFRLKC